MPDVRIDVIADTHGAPEKLKETETALGGLERQGGATNVALGGLWQQIAAGVVAAGLVQKAATIATDTFKAAIKEASEAERIDRALSAALEITGRAAAGSAEGLSRYADRMRQKTVYDDEAIKKAQTLIIQMRGTTDGLNAATKGAIGLASVFHMDLESAARAVALGFEGNYRALQTLIPAVKTAKDEGEKHAAMVKGLADYYKRAEAEVDTFSGRMDQIKSSYHNLLETLGGFVTKNKDVIDTLKGVKEIIEWVDRLAQKMDSKKGFSLFDLTAPGAMMKALKGIGEAAKKANDEYAKSLEGISLAALDVAPAIDPIPIIIRDTSASAKKAAEAMRDFERQAIAAHYAAKAPNPVPFKQFGDVLQNDILYTLTKLPPAYNRVIDVEKDLAAATKNAAQQMKKSMRDTGKDIANTVLKITEVTSVAFQQLDAVFAQSQRNKEIAIENEYKKRLAAIEASVMDEEAKNQAIEALEAEYQIKRTSAARAAAKAQKAVSLMEAINSTAAGAARAYKDYPWPMSTIVSAIVGALGLVQIGTIAAQPIPLAKGGYFKRPTVLPGRGANYLVDEDPSNPGEIVSPVPVMRQILREEIRGAGSSRVMTIAPGAIVINISAQTLDDAAIYKAQTGLKRALLNLVRTDTQLAAALAR